MNHPPTAPFRPVDLLHSGPLTAVVRCRDLCAPRDVAVKTAAVGADEATARHVLDVELRVRSTLDHPGVLALHQATEGTRGLLLVSPIVAGGALELYLAAPLPPATVCRLVDAVAGALDAVHESGWVHGDVSAANILCDWTHERFVLADFGAARRVGRRPDKGMGLQLTPSTAAPETWRAAPAEPAADVYALAVLAQLCLSGSGDARRPGFSRPPVAPETMDVLVRGMAGDPAARPHSAGALARQLRDALASETDSQDGRAPGHPAPSPQQDPVPSLARKLDALSASLDDRERRALREVLRRAEEATARATVALTAITVEAFGRAEALLAFEDSGLAAELSAGPGTAPELAARCGLAPTPTRVLLDLMRAVGFLTGNGADRYEMTPPLVSLYTGGMSGRAGPVRAAWKSWERLPFWLRTGSSPAPMDEAEGSAYRDAVDVLGLTSASDAAVLADDVRQRHALEHTRWIVDVGAGSGVWGLALLSRAPDAALIMLDRLRVLGVSRRHAESAGLASRTHAVAADWRSAPLVPRTADVVVLANTCHLEDRRGAAALIGMASGLLRAGGLLVVVDTITDASDGGALLQSLHLGMRTQRGMVHEFSDYLQWCADGGLDQPHLVRLPSGLSAMTAVMRD